MTESFQQLFEQSLASQQIRPGQILTGTVVDVKVGRGFLVADAYWLPPEGEPIGPMALDVECQFDPAGCRLRVIQSGYEPSERWKRYYAVVSRGWQLSLMVTLSIFRNGNSGTQAVSQGVRV